MSEKTKANLRRNKKFPNTKRHFSKRSNDYAAKADKVSENSGSKYYGDPINDIKWYRENDQLLNDVSRLAYNIPVGQPFARNGLLFAARRTEWSVPGIAVMDVVPTVGHCSNPVDPVNVAFNGMFTFIRSRASSKYDWDANTLAINTLATDALYYTVKWYTRLYATLPLFHHSNKYLSRALIEAQGVDYDDLLANSANFRAALNMRIARINSLKIPSEIYIFARHEWLFENYYIEGPCTKDQIYLYRPAAYYVHSYDTDGKSCLKCHRFLAGATGTDGRLTTADMIRKLDTMLDPIYNDQYFNLISGYIEQAYEGNVMSLSYIPDQMLIPLTWSEEVLLQFKNAKPRPVRHAVTGAGYVDDSFDVMQKVTSATDPRLCIKSSVTGSALKVYRSLNDGQAVDVEWNETDQYKLENFYAVANEYSKEILLTSPHADVVPAENMINTRLIPVSDFVTDPDQGEPYVKYYGSEYGTEWPLAVDIVTRYFDEITDTYGMSVIRLHEVMYYDTTDNNSAYLIPTQFIPMITKFRFMPELRMVVRLYSDRPDGVAPSAMSLFELDNYALVSHDNLDMMHQSAILSMLRVPEIASTNLSSR